MTILSKPWKVDRDGERIYCYAPGEVCVDLVSGTKEDRARVMVLLEQVQPAMALLLDYFENYELGEDCDAEMKAVLVAAGLMSEDGRRVRR